MKNINSALKEITKTCQKDTLMSALMNKSWATMAAGETPVDLHKAKEDLRSKSTAQIMKSITIMTFTCRDQILLLGNLFNDEIALHVISSKIKLKLKCFKINWIAKVTNLKKMIRKIFVVFVRIFIGIKDQTMIINNCWKKWTFTFKIWNHTNNMIEKMMKSNETFSFLIIKVTVSVTINHIFDHKFIKTYKKCHCKYFE